MIVNGYPLRCPHCGGDSFKQSRVELGQRGGLRFSGFDWFEDSMEVFACLKCGRLEWFRRAEHAQDVQVTKPDQTGKDADCSRCGTLIPATDDFCPNCGEQK